MRFKGRGALLLLIPLVCTLATLYVLISDGGSSYANYAYDMLGATGRSTTAEEDPFANLLPEPKAKPSATTTTTTTNSVSQAVQQPIVELPTASPSPSPPIQTQAENPTSQQAWTVDQQAAKAYMGNHRRHKVMVPGALQLDDSPQAHCPLAKGSWCGPYWTQPLLEPIPPPRHDRPCPDNCNNVGTCDYETGTCRCSAGWDGPDCKTPYKRKCYNMGPDKRDIAIEKGGWVHSRCSGVCDDDIGMCFCPPETKYGRIEAVNADPGTKPLQAGRPMYWCNPNTTASGEKIPWAWPMYSHEGVLGPDGFCNSDNPIQRCGCTLDGWKGPNCDKFVTQFCINQCTGHGECQLGFCRCNEGWYGHDCSRLKKGLPYPPEDGFQELAANLKRVVMHVPAAADPPARPYRKRPFVYVYELPPKYNSMMLQHRLEGGACVYRLFNDRDEAEFVHYNAYSLETVFHELMLTSEHRTYDPEEADYFYMPLYVSCLADVVGKAHIPFWPADEDGAGRWGDRAYRMSMMVLEAKRWVEAAHPYWNRTGGRDHIWVVTHDEAPCYMHNELWNSIIVSHWGRMDMPHGSRSSYHADNYTRDASHKSLPRGWIGESSGLHPCHDPTKHLVVPVFKQPIHYHDSLYLGEKAVTRDILAFFRGDMGLTRAGCVYSRCIRQTLWKLNKERQWRERFNVLYGDHSETPGDYTALLSRSKFCLVIPGDGWSARYEDSMTHGCVPVIIMDDTLGPFESLIDYTRFAIRLPEKDLDKLIEVLQAVTPAQLEAMQQAMATAWMRFRWNSLQLAEASVLHAINHNTGHTNSMPGVPGTQWAQTGDDDAFSTTIQWLYSRIPEMDRIRKKG